MSRANSFIAAATPEPYVILGLQLRPFCLGHYIWLRRFGCAFIADDETEPTRDDLVLGCLVCSMSFEEFGNWIRGEGLTVWARIAAIARLAFSFAPFGAIKTAWRASEAELAVLLWGERIGFFDVGEKSRLFQRYLKDHSEMPKVWLEEQGKETGGDWSQNVFLTLTGDCGFTTSEAYNMPLREAFLHFFRNAERSGAVTLMTDNELEATGG